MAVGAKAQTAPGFGVTGPCYSPPFCREQTCPLWLGEAPRPPSPAGPFCRESPSGVQSLSALCMKREKLSFNGPHPIEGSCSPWVPACQRAEGLGGHRLGPLGDLPGPGGRGRPAQLSRTWTHRHPRHLLRICRPLLDADGIGLSLPAGREVKRIARPRSVPWTQRGAFLYGDPQRFRRLSDPRGRREQDLQRGGRIFH